MTHKIKIVGGDVTWDWIKGDPRFGQQETITLKVPESDWEKRPYTKSASAGKEIVFIKVKDKEGSLEKELEAF